MNKKGQTIIFAFMLFVVIIVLALGLAFPVRQSASISMNTMNCSNSTTSDYTQAGCYVEDMTPFFFIAALVGIGGTILIARILFA